MKKILMIIVTIISFVIQDVLLLAEEEKTLPKHIIGIETLSLFPIISDNNRNKGGINIFYRNNLFLTNNYLTANVGYIHYKEDEKIRNDYSVTFGFLSYDISNTYYTELEVGILHKNQKSYYDNLGNFYESSNGLKPLISLNIGYSFPELSRFKIYLASKFRFSFEKEINGVLVGGISYMF